MQSFSIKVGQKKFHVTQSAHTILIMCDDKEVRKRTYDTTPEAEHEYEVILDTLNDVGENFD